MATFLASGADILLAPNVNVLSNTGQDSAGQITVTGGTQPFSDQAVVEFTVDPVPADGELTSSSGFTQIVVYATQADYLAGTPTYTYTPQNPGQSASVQDSIDRMGDDYLRFSANILTSSDTGAPSLQELFVAPGSNVANQSSTTFDHHTDQDFDNSGDIDDSSAENGNGRFNVNSGQSNAPVCFTSGSYIQTPRGPILIETLKPGDMVLTLDDGPQPILWIGKRHLGPADLLMRPQDRPILIAKGTFGAKENTFVSPQHCVLVRPDLLMPAKKIVAVKQSRARIAQGKWNVIYIHLFFQRHQVIWVNGMPTESLYPGSQCLKQLSTKQCDELKTVLPEGAMEHRQTVIEDIYGPTARPIERNPKRVSPQAQFGTFLPRSPLFT
ncbi:MAG: Hint domain-containing protein [Paracoccaceae bacterium]